MKRTAGDERLGVRVEVIVTVATVNHAFAMKSAGNDGMQAGAEVQTLPYTAGVWARLPLLWNWNASACMILA